MHFISRPNTQHVLASFMIKQSLLQCEMAVQHQLPLPWNYDSVSDGLGAPCAHLKNSGGFLWQRDMGSRKGQAHHIHALFMIKQRLLQCWMVMKGRLPLSWNYDSVSDGQGALCAHSMNLEGQAHHIPGLGHDQTDPVAMWDGNARPTALALNPGLHIRLL